MQLESTTSQLKDALNRVNHLETLLNEKESDLQAISKACSELETENEKVCGLIVVHYSIQ